MSIIARISIIAALAFAVSAMSGRPSASAGTTGEIQGFVTDASSRPLDGVTVTAAAPSGHTIGTTGVTGFYAINGLPPDTYTVTFSRDGYLARSLSGVATVQDQSVRVDVQMQLGMKTLARIDVRHTTSLVQPTVTADTYVISESRLAGLNGTPQDLNGIQALNSLPGVTADNLGLSIIRASEQNDIGYLYDGVDNTDVLVHGILNSFSLNGTRSFQLSTGGYDVSNGNINSGVVNQVIRRGTYPPRGQTTIRVESPLFGHELSFDYGNATPSNRFSYYIAFGGQADASAYGDRATSLPLELDNTQFSTDDDDVLNFFYHFGRGDKNEVQLLSNVSGGTTTYGYLVNSAVAPYASNNGDVQSSSDPFGLGPQPAGHPSTFQSDYITLYPGQAAYRQDTGGADTLTFNSIIDKASIKRQLTPSSFAEVRLYRASENLVIRQPYHIGSFSETYADVQTTGLGEAFDFADQLSSRHELSFGGEGAYYKNRAFGGFGASPSLEPSFEPLEALGCPQVAAAIGAGLLVPSGSFNATPGIGGCYIAPFNDAMNVAIPTLGLPTDAAHAPLNTFVSDFQNVDDPVYRYDLWAKDRAEPSERLTMTLGVRWDKEVIPLPADAAARNTTYYIDGSGDVVTVLGRPIGTDVTHPQQVSPRFAASYEIGPRDVVRFSYGKNIEFAPLYSIERSFRVPAYLHDCTIADGCFLALPGYGKTNHVTDLYQQVAMDLTTHENAQYAPVLPQRAVNIDFSYTHDFGNGLEARVTPYYRRGTDYSIGNQPLLFALPASGLPVFGASSQESAGVNENTGVEFALLRDSENGLSGLLDATYDNTLANYDGDFFPNVNNAAIAAGHFFHVTYVPAVSGALNLVYSARHAWHASTTVLFHSGYRYGVGTKTFVFIDGIPVQVLNTDLASTPSQAYYFTASSNPGTIAHPNIVASRGTPEGADPGTLFTPATAIVNATLSHEIGSTPHEAEVGVRVQNLFGNYTPTVIPANVYYVPQGSGSYGPGSGRNKNACAPGQTVGCEPFMYDQSPYPYENEPSGLPRVYTFFVSIRY